MKLKEVVMKLNGPIKPMAETIENDRRFENLKTLCLLVGALVSEIDEVACACKDHQEYNLKRAGEHADAFLTSLGIEE